MIKRENNKENDNTPKTWVLPARGESYVASATSFVVLTTINGFPTPIGMFTETTDRTTNDWEYGVGYLDNGFAIEDSFPSKAASKRAIVARYFGNE